MALKQSSNQDISGFKIYYTSGNNANHRNKLNDIIAVSMSNSPSNNRHGRRHHAIDVHQTQEGTSRTTELANETKDRTNGGTRRTNITAERKGRCSCKVILAAVFGLVLLWAASAVCGAYVYHVIKGQEDALEADETNTTEELKDTVSKLSAEMDELRTVHRLKARNESKGGQVAFTVHTPTGMLAEDDVPTFKNIILNTGGGYNNSSGKFRCPIAGLYLFTYTIGSSTSHKYSTFCTLYKNTETITAVYKQKWTMESASIALFLELSEDNQVYFACHNWKYIYGDHHTFFSGSLIT